MNFRNYLDYSRYEDPDSVFFIPVQTEEFARKCICAAYDENSGIGVITKDSFIERMEMSLPIHKFSEVTKIYTVRIENKVYPPSRSTIDLWKRCFDDLDTAKV